MSLVVEVPFSLLVPLDVLLPNDPKAKMGGEVKVVVEPADDSELTEMMLTGEATAELLLAAVFFFGTLLLLFPGLLLFLLVLVRIRGSVVPEVDEEVDEEVDDRRSLARRNVGSRGAADKEACLFDTPIDGIVAKWRWYDGFDLGIPIQRHQGSKARSRWMASAVEE